MRFRPGIVLTALLVSTCAPAWAQEKLTHCTNTQANVSTVAFGGQTLGTTARTRTVTITNLGGGLCSESPTFTTASFAPAAAGFTVTRNTCQGVRLTLGHSCEVDVTFAPGATAGAQSATLNLPWSYIYIAPFPWTGTVSIALSATGETSLVSHFYNAILNRAPDSAGKAYWDSEAVRLAALGVNINEVWFVVSGYFFNSPEYTDQGKSPALFVTDLYNTFFNRPPDTGGLNYWVSQLDAGMPREVVLFSFMFSNEFRTFTQGMFGSTTARPEVDMVVDFFRGLLNRLPDTPSFNYWLGRLRAAQCQGAGPVYTAVDEISAAFMFNPEYTNRSRINRQFVTDMYYSFLRRGGDLSGVQFWIDQVNTGTPRNNVRYYGFLNSPEFGARVQAVIAAGCVP